MIQINNGFDECYYLDFDRVYNSATQKYITTSANNKFSMKTKDGQWKTISLNRLVKIVYGKTYAIDLIESYEDEEWKQLAKDSVYFISNYGRVKSNKFAYSRILTPDINNGYARVKIDLGYGKRNYYVHKLCAQNFIKCDIPFGEIHHINFNKLDNSSKNLVCLSRDEHRKLHNQIRKEQKQIEQEKNTNGQTMV